MCFQEPYLIRVKLVCLTSHSIGHMRPVTTQYVCLKINKYNESREERIQNYTQLPHSHVVQHITYTHVYVSPIMDCVIWTIIRVLSILLLPVTAIWLTLLLLHTYLCVSSLVRLQSKFSWNSTARNPMAMITYNYSIGGANEKKNKPAFSFFFLPLSLSLSLSNGRLRAFIKADATVTRSNKLLVMHSTGRSDEHTLATQHACNSPGRH